MGHQVKCFFNESEEFHLVDGHDGALVFTNLRDGKATIDAEPNGLRDAPVPVTVIDGLKSDAAEALWLVGGWDGLGGA